MAGLTRRRLLAGAGGAAALAGGAVIWQRSGLAAYGRAAAEVWAVSGAVPQGLPDAGPWLVHQAILAANGHNTQPWRFELMPDRIAIRPDLARRTPVVDPDDHHLYASLGCAAENLVTAAAAAGLAAEVEAGAAGVLVRLAPAAPVATPRFRTIPFRQSVRFDYGGQPVAAEEAAALEAAATGDGVEAYLYTARGDRDRIAEMVIAGNTAQMGDPAFVAELKHWIRFNGGQAAASRDGLYAGATGAPQLPAWLGRRLFDFGFTVAGENAKYARHLATSAGVVVLAAGTDDPPGWIAAGRAAQRFALEAMARGLKYAFVNQPVEVPSVRPELQRFLGTDRRPNLVMRFGAGPDAPRSLRRPVAAVIA